MAKKKKNQPWWLDEGTEICPSCGQTYVYQTEYRCGSCDSVVCAMCVTENSEAILVCVGCCENKHGE